MSRGFKSSTELQTKKANVSSVTLGLEGTSDPVEARYWTQKFGLGTTFGTSNPRYSYPRSLRFQSSSNAIVQQVLFGPPAFGSQAPLAVVSGPRVSLYSGPIFQKALDNTYKNNASTVRVVAPDRNVGTGGHPALCASYRSDGRLLAIGTDQGDVRVCDATSRATLCTFRSNITNSNNTNNNNANHLAIRAVAWLRNGKQIVSAGDDAVLRLWSLHQATEGTARLTLSGHGDSIRSMLVWQPRHPTQQKQNEASDGWNELAITGSYDHTIRIWNIETTAGSDEVDATSRCLAVLSHGAPVEALMMMPHTNPDKSPPWLLSAGGTTVKVWNALTGVCVHTINTQHSKTITCLTSILRNSGGGGEDDEQDQDKNMRSTTPPSWRILTAGLDGLVRIHTWSSDTGEMAHIHGVKLSDPITSMAVNERMDRLAIGFTTGQILVKKHAPSVMQSKRKREPKAGTYAYFTRGMNVAAEDGDYVASQDRQKKLRSFDKALKQFRYGDALDQALETRQPQAVVAVLEELGKRRGLTTALSNRDEETLEPLLSFTVRYITGPRFSSLLIGVAHKLCDIYGGLTGQSERIDELFDKLRLQVCDECRVQKSLLRIVGQLDAIMTVAELEEDMQHG